MNSSVRVRYVQPSVPLSKLGKPGNHRPDGGPRIHVSNRHRANGPQLARAARRARLAQVIRQHIKTSHAGEDVAPLHLGAFLYAEGEEPQFCELCGDVYVSRRKP